MELFRSLAVLAESPGPVVEPAASALGFTELPDESSFTDLFSLQLFPYASVYLGSEGMVGGEARDRIAGFWRAIGETPPNEPDHLTVLLAAYSELAERESGATDTQEAARWQHARVVFFWEHLATWLPPYLDRVLEIGSTFYRRWAELLAGALSEEAEELGPPSEEPLHFRKAPVLGSLAGSSADEVLQSLLCPIRTGVILVRTDLLRCSRDVDLGLRIGERKFTLESLLGQAPRETLEWLAAEAKKRSVEHGGRPGALRPVSKFWKQRAADTSNVLRRSAAAVGA